MDASLGIGPHHVPGIAAISHVTHTAGHGSSSAIARLQRPSNRGRTSHAPNGGRGSRGRRRGRRSVEGMPDHDRSPVGEGRHDHEHKGRPLRRGLPWIRFPAPGRRDRRLSVSPEPTTTTSRPLSTARPNLPWARSCGCRAPVSRGYLREAGTAQDRETIPPQERTGCHRRRPQGHGSAPLHLQRSWDSRPLGHTTTKGNSSSGR